jgi:hypothetical protein
MDSRTFQVKGTVGLQSQCWTLPAHSGVVLVCMSGWERKMEKGLEKQAAYSNQIISQIISGLKCQVVNFVVIIQLLLIQTIIL